MTANGLDVTVDQWLGAATKRLHDAGVESARLDCLIFLEDALKRSRAWLLAYPEQSLTTKQVVVLNTKLVQRQQHIPLAYIRGHSEFYGRTFIVNQHVLVPRPETETMVALLLALPEAKLSTIIDVGTGSGALAVTTSLELPQAAVLATDIDGRCLDAGRQNALRLGATVEFVKADLLQPLGPGMQALPAPDIVLANLPYVPDNYTINRAASHEPRLALFAGSDGLELYRQLFSQLQAISQPRSYVLTEALESQHADLAKVATAAGYKLELSKDLIQVFTKL